MTLTIRPGDVRDPRLVALLEAHMRDMYATSPPESVHTLDLDALAAPNVVVLTAWETTAPAPSVSISDECERNITHSRPKRSHSSGPMSGESTASVESAAPTADGDAGVLLGCGAMKLDVIDGERCGEVKSMRTQPAARGRGVASRVLDALVKQARAEGVTRLYLETGPQEFFAPARALYATHGFVECRPFGDYQLDPYSVFMTRAL